MHALRQPYKLVETTQTFLQCTQITASFPDPIQLCLHMERALRRGYVNHSIWLLKIWLTLLNTNNSHRKVATDTDQPNCDQYKRIGYTFKQQKGGRSYSLKLSTTKTNH